MLCVETLLIVSLFWINEFVAQIEELFESLPSKGVFVVIDFQDCIASTDVLDEQWEEGVYLVLDWALHIQFQVDDIDGGQCARIVDCFDNSEIVVHFDRSELSKVVEEACRAFQVNIYVLCRLCICVHTGVLGLAPFFDSLLLVCERSLEACIGASSASSLIISV